MVCVSTSNAATGYLNFCYVLSICTNKWWLFTAVTTPLSANQRPDELAALKALTPFYD
jgi:hypothetical protein